MSNSKCLLKSLAFLVSLSIVISGISDDKNYSNISGTQIYLFENKNEFSYISVDNSSTSILKATLYLYSSSSVSALKSKGIWTSIGFGSTEMKNSDIYLCGMNKDETLWCKQFDGVRENIFETSNSNIKVTNSKITELGNDYSPYVTKIEWSFEKAENTSKWTVNGIINGTVKAISAMGYVPSSEFPQEHRIYYTISTGDGNKKPSTTTTTTTTTTSTTTGTNTNTNNNNLQGGDSYSLKYSIYILILILLII